MFGMMPWGGAAAEQGTVVARLPFEGNANDLTGKTFTVGANVNYGSDADGGYLNPPATNGTGYGVFCEHPSFVVTQSKKATIEVLFKFESSSNPGGFARFLFSLLGRTSAGGSTLNLIEVYGSGVLLGANVWTTSGLIQRTISSSALSSSLRHLAVCIDGQNLAISLGGQVLVTRSDFSTISFVGGILHVGAGDQNQNATPAKIYDFRFTKDATLYPMSGSFTPPTSFN